MEKLSEAGHWYTKDGEPKYTLIGKNKKKSLIYTLGRRHWTTKHISTMKKRLSKDRFAVWYKNYMKELGQDK